MDQISHRHPDHGLLAPLPAPSVQKLQLFNQPFLSYCFISLPEWAFGEHIISDEYKTWHFLFKPASTAEHKKPSSV